MTKFTPNVYSINQNIKETDEELTITVKLKIKKSKQGMKYINHMYEKQQSPVVTILSKIERERKKEIKDGKYMRPYYIEGKLNEN